ncbi:hypothetical protein AMURIS_04791 [Acetatifactor muris]|uniref:IrrE N-terminal-like domain-containing protein n=2 Tax=Acetatifactor muris TaxID=879566 RepID=A0A2K4ZNI2_9FIRM|nr:hypothetical protein AMURIS_04791 [Acetatifactor muris]
MQKVVVEPMSRNQIRDFTKAFRKIIGMENALYFPIVQFIEWVLPQMGLDYEYVSEQEMGNAYGITHTGKGIMKIREDVYERAIKGNPRDRFTLCHELGHFLMHSPERVGFARGDAPAYMDPEWQANVFAGELMAPFDLVKNMSVSEISQKCGMSMQAAQVQYSTYHNAM